MCYYNNYTVYTDNMCYYNNYTVYTDVLTCVI